MIEFKPGVDNAIARAGEWEQFLKKQQAAGQSWTVYVNGQPFMGCPNETVARQLCRDYGGKRAGYTCSQDRLQ